MSGQYILEYIMRIIAKNHVGASHNKGSFGGRERINSIRELETEVSLGHVNRADWGLKCKRFRDNR